MSGEGDGKWNTQAHRKQRRKNIVLLLALAGFALLFYLITIVRLGGGMMGK